MDITSAEFQAGFGDDTIVGGLFDPLPANETPASVLLKAIKAYSNAQSTYNAANPASLINLISPATPGTPEVSEGSINRPYTRTMRLS